MLKGQTKFCGKEGRGIIYTEEIQRTVNMKWYLYQTDLGAICSVMMQKKMHIRGGQKYS